MSNLLMKTVVLAIAAFLPSLAHAQFSLRVDDGGTNGIVIKDNGAGDSDATLGAIVWTGVLGGFTFNLTTGISKPLSPSSSFLGHMDLNEVTIHGTGPGTIRLFLEDSGFGSAWPSWTQTGNIGGALYGTGATITAQDWVNTSNNLPDFGTPTTTGEVGTIAAFGGLPPGLPAGDNFALAGSPFSAGPGAFSGSASSIFSTAGPFSMFQRVTVSFEGEGSVSFNNEHIAAIPEPETYAMLLAGLGLMAFVARRRQRNLAA